MQQISAETERSFEFCDMAVAQMKGRLITPIPRNYDVWYTYASGYNTALSDAINAILDGRGAITQDEIDHIHETHLSAMRLGDEIDKVGERFQEELNDLLKVVEGASGRASRFSDDLASASTTLASGSQDAILMMVERLYRSTRAIETHNKALEERLARSREEIHELQENLNTVRVEAFTDPLTSLANRKFYDQAIAKALAAATAGAGPLSLIVCDIDHFKKFNDTYGHLTGDQVLRLVGQSLRHNVKGRDVACRYGGEEFVVILPETNLRSAITVGEHIRRAVMTKELVKRSTNETLGRITISVGVATFRADDNAASLYERADACLYAAKRAGRNRVICETDPEADAVKKVA